MYYLWFNETQSGPYTLQQVQSMWKAGQITSETLFWQDGAKDWLPLGEIVNLIETTPESVAETTVIPNLQMPGRMPIQRSNLSAMPGANAEQVVPEKDIWTGHPTLWKWAGLMLLALVILVSPAALFVFLPNIHLLALAPLPIALIIFGYIYIKRSSTKFTVTNKRIGVETGILTKTSRELRIQDIRSIAAKTNFLGYGNIEFSSAASDDVDVVFTAVASANSVRDMVKKLQN